VDLAVSWSVESVELDDAFGGAVTTALLLQRLYAFMLGDVEGRMSTLGRNPVTTLAKNWEML